MAPVKTLARRGIVTIAPAAIRRDPLVHREILKTEPLKLMPEQRAALDLVCEVIERQCRLKSGPGAVEPAEGRQSKDPHVVLLYGVTGSGKTEVYLQAIEKVLAKGMGAVVLVPEISLTPQTVERFVGRFGPRVAVLHSNLSEGERHDEWHRVRDGKADIVVGARSAVFAPMANLGLIVVDEEHEPTYKQDDAPRYNARDVAVMRGRMERCAVLLGTATPALESWRNATAGKYGMAKLPQRADHKRMPVIRIVDMRNAGAGSAGRGSIFSRDLLEAIGRRLDRAEQTMLFLNRRGFATSLICMKCGYVARCDNCSVACTYHRDADVLQCHICGAARKVPGRCPGCQDPAFKYSGVGTQRVESVLQRLFPKARIQRMDADVTGTKGSHGRILDEFRSGNTDILVGTQMIAKGLHFPNVTLVGVIHADLSLHMPDFRAGERTFQLLAQVAGRSGRGDVLGEVIVQTYTPFHPAIQSARRLDFEGFADQEAEFRKELSYPPFAHLVCLTLKGRSEQRTTFVAASLFKRLKREMPEGVLIAGPSPAPIARAKGLYRFQVMLRSASVGRIVRGVRNAMRGFAAPADVQHTVDVDAVSLM
jgi:primosomal protein N' (replication factor Y)